MYLDGSWYGHCTITRCLNDDLAGTDRHFCLQARNHLLGRFTGTVQEEGERAIPGTGYVEGHCLRGRITFVVQMPVFYTYVDGKSMPLTEAAPLLYGTTLREELAHPKLHYEGRWEQSTERFSGTWHLEPCYVALLDRQVLFSGPEGV